MPKGRVRLHLTHYLSGRPIANALIHVDFGNLRHFDMRSDAGGDIEFEAETPPIDESLTTDPSEKPYQNCNLHIEAADMIPVLYEGNEIFPEQTSIVNIAMHDAARMPRVKEEIIHIPEHLLWATNPNNPNRQSQTEYNEEEETDEFVPAIVSYVPHPVVIPSSVTVHMGPPGSAAKNITVSFPDYIKNVASSEIFPTWPESSIEANIIAQISIALNRFYTEWYRSRGYNFDITSSTATDQKFIEDRPIFERVSEIVDRIFHDYAARDGYYEPLYATFCDGVQSQCDGLSQWGTVSLSEQGYSPLQILQYYYGNDVGIRTAPSQPEGGTSSFAENLTRGMKNEQIRALQQRLNRIAINYPAIPFVPNARGEYNAYTEQAVRTFQRIFGLPETGVVDERTWYNINQIYNGVKKLAETGSEGLRVDDEQFPGYVLSEGVRNTAVLRMQQYLEVISEYVGSGIVPEPNVSGIYDSRMSSVVSAFQEYADLPVTGTIDEATWNAIVDSYYTFGGGTEGGIYPPIKEYPGYPLAKGARGEYVVFLQEALNTIAGDDPSLPRLNVDGDFGESTAEAIRLFQQIYELPVDRVVGPLTWQAIVSEYKRVTGQ